MPPCPAHLHLRAREASTSQLPPHKRPYLMGRPQRPWDSSPVQEMAFGPPSLALRFAEGLQGGTAGGWTGASRASLGLASPPWRAGLLVGRQGQGYRLRQSGEASWRRKRLASESFRASREGRLLTAPFTEAEGRLRGGCGGPWPHLATWGWGKRQTLEHLGPVALCAPFQK